MRIPIARKITRNVLSQSGAFAWKPDGEKEWEWLNRQLAASPRLSLRFSFEAGLLEGTWWCRDFISANVLSHQSGSHCDQVIENSCYPRRVHV
jgi:hypothetical protein